ESAYGPVVDSLAPHTATIVVLMGLAAVRPLARRLIARGWRETTPAAIVLAAASAAARTVVADLASLASADRLIETDRPGTIVIGEVVRVREAVAAVTGRAESVGDWVA